MNEEKAIAVVGAGLIGRKHIQAIGSTGGVTRLQAIVDPSPAARDFAAELGASWFADMAALLATGKPDGVVIATPNQLHMDNGLQAIEAGLPALIEKPITVSTAEGLRLVEAAESGDVPLLIGHHRRYNPLIERASALIDEGRIGIPVSVNAMGWLGKPDEYFVPDWRRAPGAGPVLTNLIHDIDLMQHLVGPIERVSAILSSRTRGHTVEDTAVLTFVFENGALGTANISDTIVAPWSWELTARENPAYPPTNEACYLIGGTKGALELPALKLWHQNGTCDWWKPMEATQLPYSFEDPLVRQMRHFADVIGGTAFPHVSGRDGLQALRVIEAIHRSAASGMPETVARG